MGKPFTNPLALEWLVKADADFVTAKRECRARKLPNYDAASWKDELFAPVPEGFDCTGEESPEFGVFQFRG